MVTKMNAHLIMPMAGAGSRFSKQGVAVPKPLITIEGKPFFYWAAMSIVKYVSSVDLTFAVLEEHVKANQIDQEIHAFFPDADMVVLPSVLPGPVFTCLEGIKNIHDDAPVIFNDCDHLFKAEGLNRALMAGSLDADGALVTFRSNEPQFSFVQYDAVGKIVGTVEKKVVSDNAICGAYVFRSAHVFREAAQAYLHDCPYSEYYISGLYNILCEKGKKVSAYPVDFHVEFGTPEEYARAKDLPIFAEL